MALICDPMHHREDAISDSENALDTTPGRDSAQESSMIIIIICDIYVIIFLC